jgi:hypothetical protein
VRFGRRSEPWPGFGFPATSGSLSGMSFDSLTLAAAICVGGAVGWGWRSVRGSTAVPAAGWALAAAAVFLLEVVARGSGRLVDPAGQAAVRLVGAALAVCPTMSLLGAKRPQHGVWQLIVGSLAFVLALPAVSAALVRPGSMPDVHLLERGFLALLLVVGWMNFVGTRHGLAATLVTVGLAALMRSFLPGGGTESATQAGVDAAGATAVGLGAMLSACQSAWWPARAANSSANHGALIERPFLALRETLGAAWTLRIAERFNTVARERNWPCRLHFGGLAMEESGEGSVGWERDALRCSRALMRRFVSEAWLDRHGSGSSLA